MYVLFYKRRKNFLINLTKEKVRNIIKKEFNGKLVQIKNM